MSGEQLLTHVIVKLLEIILGVEMTLYGSAGGMIQALIGPITELAGGWLKGQS